MVEYEIKYKCGCGTKLNTYSTGVLKEDTTPNLKIKCTDCKKIIEVSYPIKKFIIENDIRNKEINIGIN